MSQRTHYLVKLYQTISYIKKKIIATQIKTIDKIRQNDIMLENTIKTQQKTKSKQNKLRCKNNLGVQSNRDFLFHKEGKKRKNEINKVKKSLIKT